MKIQILLLLTIVLIVRNSDLQKNLKRNKGNQIQNSKEKSLDSIESQLKLKLKKSAPRFKKNMKVDKKSESERDSTENNKSYKSDSQHNSQEVLNKNNVEQQENQGVQENANEQSQQVKEDNHEKKEDNNHVEEMVQQHNEEKDNLHHEEKKQDSHNVDKIQQNNEDKKEDNNQGVKQSVYVQQNNNHEEESHSQLQEVVKSSSSNRSKNEIKVVTTTTITTNTVQHESHAAPVAPVHHFVPTPVAPVHNVAPVPPVRNVAPPVHIVAPVAPVVAPVRPVHNFTISTSTSSATSTSTTTSTSSSSATSTKKVITSNSSNTNSGETSRSTTNSTSNQNINKAQQQSQNDKEKVNSFLPTIIGLGDTVNITQLNMQLMTENKFNQEFEKWQDSDYVMKISEYGRQELKAKRSGKKKEFNVIKNSFIKDKELNEEPMIYKEVQGTQFTDVLTPVQQTSTQSQLWKNFKTSHFYDVDYKGREDDKSNQELQYDSEGNTKIYERVINKRPVKIHNTSIKVDIDPNGGMLDDIVNPLQPLTLDKQTDKNIKLDYQNNEYKKSSKTLDNVIEDIDQEIKSN